MLRKLFCLLTASLEKGFRSQSMSRSKRGAGAIAKSRAGARAKAKAGAGARATARSAQSGSHFVVSKTLFELLLRGPVVSC